MGVNGLARVRREGPREIGAEDRVTSWKALGLSWALKGGI